jgi:microcystin-dependent protein
MKSYSSLRTPLRLAASCVFTLAAGLALRAADANPPDKMSYQGYLVDANGNALGSTNTGPKNYDVIFRVWNDQTATTGDKRLWTEQQTVTVDKGYFSILLGEGSAYGNETRPALASLFAGADASDRFVELTVRGIGPGGADSTILPRTRLLPAPYAFLAKNAVNANTLVNPANQPVMTVSDTSVGINRVSPASALDVNGTVTASGLTVNGTASAGTMNANTVNAGSVAATTVSSTTVNATTVNGFGTIPIGGIIMWSGSSVPNGWALCDGQTYYGQRTPDLRGRFVLGSGSGSGLTARGLNQTGGEENHALTANEMPSHAHSVDPPSTSTSITGSHIHDSGLDRWPFSAGSWAPGQQGVDDTFTSETTIWTDSAGNHSHLVDITPFSSGSTGGNAAHNTMPPYYVLAFIMRVQ